MNKIEMQVSDYKKKRFYFVLLITEVILLVCVNLFPIVKKIAEPDMYTSGILHLKVLSFTERVVPGGQAHLKLQGEPYHTYRLDVKYTSGYSEAKGVGIRSANSKGIVEWRWKVGTNTYPGEFKATIHGTRHSGYVYIQVVNIFKRMESTTVALMIFDCILADAIVFTLIAYLDKKSQICSIEGTPEKEPPEKLSVLLCFLGAVLSSGLVIGGALCFISFLLSIMPDALRLVIGYIILGIICLLFAAPLVLTIYICIINRKNKRS